VAARPEARSREPGASRLVAARSRVTESQDRDVVVQVTAVEVAHLVNQPVQQRVVADLAGIEWRRAQRVPYQADQAFGAEAVRAAADPALDQPVGIQQQ
jgi:hypothetical protein